MVCIALEQDSCYQKILNNIQEIKARSGCVIAIINDADHGIRNMGVDFIEIPVCDPMRSLLLLVLPLQLVA